MESKTCGGGVGGNGFMTLVAADFRLAHMQDHGQGQVSFYQLDNRPVWIEVLSATKGNVLDALRVGLNSGELELKKHIRSPSGLVRIKTFDCSKVSIEKVGDETFERLGTIFPKRLALKGPEADQYNAYPVPVLRVQQIDGPVAVPTKENAQP